MLKHPQDKKKKNDKKDIEKPLMLTIEQRSEIAARELEIFRNELKKCKEDALKEVDGLKVFYFKLSDFNINFDQAEIEELELRLAGNICNIISFYYPIELKKAAFEFKRLIIQQSVNPRTNTIIAEKVIRYYEDKLRYKVKSFQVKYIFIQDSIIEKTRLNNATLKGQKNRLQIQLKQKEEM